MISDPSRSKVRLFAFGGSTRNCSFSLKALTIAAEGASEAGAEIDIFPVAELDLPIYRPEVSIRDLPPTVAKFVGRVQRADAYLFCSPSYHGSLSGVFKNAVDYLDLLKEGPFPYLKEKPVGLIAVGSGGVGVVNTMNAMIDVAFALRALVVPGWVTLSRVERLFDMTGKMCEAEAGRLRALGRRTAKYASIT